MKKTLLITTVSDDVHADSVIRLLEDNSQIQIIRFNTDCFSENDLFFQISNEGIISEIFFPHINTTLSIEDIDIAWFRKLGSHDDSPYKNFVNRQTRVFYDFICNLIPRRKWVNYPLDIFTQNSKPFLLYQAMLCGLSIPRTIITNKLAAIMQIMHDHPTISKSIDSGMSYIKDNNYLVIHTTRLTEEEIAESDIANSPNYLQELIKAEFEVRVTVVGEHIFCCKMTGAVFNGRSYDIRPQFNELTYSTVDCPPHVRSCIFELSSRIGMAYMAMDFIVDGDHNWIFLEANLSGQWLWIENETGLPISKQMASLLERRLFEQ